MKQPGHEYTKSNVKFALSVLQSEAVKNLQTFTESNKQTQGKFTIGDEKVSATFVRRVYSVLIEVYSNITFS